MTCIVGIAEGGKVWIGGDSAGVNDALSISSRADTKVFTNGEFVFGFCGSFRMGQLIHHAFEPPNSFLYYEDLEAYMVTEFIDAIRECFREGGFLYTDKGLEEGGTFLVGTQGRLFCVQGDFQVEENIDPYSAIGCGGDIALGSLYSTDGQKPKRRIELALRAATHLSAGVRPPYVVCKV